MGKPIVMFEVSVGIMINQVVSNMLVTEAALESLRLCINPAAKLVKAGAKMRCFVGIDTRELFG